jgi:putative intracellular protease/amidase
MPNRPDTDTPTHPAVIKAVQRAHQRGARLVGLCTGAYTLAEAGLLDGRPAAVHWQLAGDFRRRHPKVDLQPDVLFVDDGDILTSAGSAAALDLALHIVRLDHGAQVANFVSRRLVFSAFRDGGQQQFIEQPVTSPGQPALSQTLDWARARLGTTLCVADLARHAHLSATTLHRRFRAPSWAPRRWRGSPPNASTWPAASLNKGSRRWTWSLTAAASGQRPTSAPSCDAGPGSAHLSTAPASRTRPGFGPGKRY